ncbi:MAG: hypothetical protein HC893_02480 [Chloroflexaceae bacterium]|nr:hypothetical protein [Chloroflexaceae bacterium]NJL32910.1 hypothetical protein [Chloroflexaceae bacterium]NJO04494.1 hypothetical protein [Chloroflexaceae bacterium]
MLNPTPDTNDASRVTWHPFLRVWLVVTAVFVLYLIIVLLAGSLPPTPNLSTPYSVEEWREEVRPAQLEQLNTYSWMNEEEGVVAIPIDRAKDLIVERGLPVREGEDSTTE